MAPRRDPGAVLGAAGVDEYVSRLGGGGAAGGGDGGWGDGGWGAGGGAGAGAAGARRLRGSCWEFTWDEGMQLVAEERAGREWSASRGGPGAVVEQVFPDCSYCRQPLDLRALEEAGAPSVTFESGCVLRDGGVARWLLTYRLEGPRRRLIESAVYERYVPADDGWGA
ncbi:MAG: hypothetical protein J3K34DRAFT_453170 [Monoraphidium minutum]|nr:MAG: hypothetical protein J3K34DRAFT_453170 [Monoraphidium minutum]